jgi:Na+-translocating ferredoxin:NAD+ oxidoreductase RnfD subunit
LGFEAEGAWQACSALIVLGGVAVCVARPSNALALAGTLTAGAVTSYALWALGSLPFDSPHEALLANGFLYGACFLACDPATCPGTRSGKLLHGFIVGSLAVVIRSMSNYHEGMLSAILIANVFAPTINMMGSSGISSNSDPGTPAYEGMPLRDEE